MTYEQASFPEIRGHTRPHAKSTGLTVKITADSGRTQSERDWRFALRALARGDDPLAVAGAIAAYRHDKPNPQYYAEYTVERRIGLFKAERIAKAACQPTPTVEHGTRPRNLPVVSAFAGTYMRKIMRLIELLSELFTTCGEQKVKAV